MLRSWVQAGVALLATQALAAAPGTAHADALAPIVVRVSESAVSVEGREVVRLECARDGGAPCTAADRERRRGCAAVPPAGPCAGLPALAIASEFKGDGVPQSYAVPGLQRELEGRRRARSSAEACGVTAPALRIEADPATPFRVLSEVLYNAGQAALLAPPPACGDETRQARTERLRQPVAVIARPPESPFDRSGGRDGDSQAVTIPSLATAETLDDRAVVLARLPSGSSVLGRLGVPGGGGDPLAGGLAGPSLDDAPDPETPPKRPAPDARSPVAPQEDGRERPLNVTVVITAAGFRVVGWGIEEARRFPRRTRAGCDGGALREDYDYAALYRFVAGLRARDLPDPAIYVGAESQIPWAVVSRTLDALRWRLEPDAPADDCAFRRAHAKPRDGGGVELLYPDAVFVVVE